MADAKKLQNGLAWSLVGWSIQTAGLAGFWPQLSWSAVQFGFIIATALIGTLTLAYGLSLIANSRGHTPAFGALAIANLVGLIMVGMLPDLNPTEVRRIEFKCPHCEATTWIELEHTGQTGPCRSCGLTVQVPSLLSAADVREIEGDGLDA